MAKTIVIRADENINKYNEIKKIRKNTAIKGLCFKHESGII